ncbi:MAG: PHP domain-containing protein [Lachnospiraceae bacterium]|nr:PHP domain-containing protein [Lachnospiraceae bacterium]
MLQDLHSHTYYSFCGIDTPESVVEAAIQGGLHMIGISDHAHGVGEARYQHFKAPLQGVEVDYERTTRRYFDHLSLIKEKYAGQIEVLRGIEVATVKKHYAFPEKADISFFDYCLVEHLDFEETITEGDIFAFAKRCGCPTGIAHTDMFAFIASRGEDPLDYFTRMAQQGIFWEMNVNLDNVHRGYEHPYMLEFFESREQQEIVRKSGVRLSVGFDGHRVSDYKPNRIADYCTRIGEMGIKLMFE